MGNHKFRLSDMMPNAWFYKLKDMSKHSSSSTAAAASHHHSNHHKTKNNDTNHKQKQHMQQHVTKRHNHPTTPSRKSYHFNRTNSTSVRYSSSISHSKSSSIDSLFPDPVKTLYRSDLAPPPTPSPVEIRSDRALIPTELLEENVSWSSSSNYEPRNIVIDVNDNIQLAAKIENSEDFVTIFDVELRPIVTKPKSDAEHMILQSLKASKTERRKSAEHMILKSLKVSKTERRQSAEHMILKSLKTTKTEQRQSVSKGVKMRKANSPRIVNNGTFRRKSVSATTTRSSSSSKKSVLTESLAIVKRSKNPKEDFKKSMMEMIVEHEIRSSKELEELLACYLSLNSDEYHDLIISVFKQIWFQVSNNDNNMMRRRRSKNNTISDEEQHH